MCLVLISDPSEAERGTGGQSNCSEQDFRVMPKCLSALLVILNMQPICMFSYSSRVFYG